MKLKDLQVALQAVHPGAVLVSSRVLDRGLQQQFHIPSYRVWDVPHRASLVVDRQKLVSFIEPDDLELKPDQVLPDQVILLAKPTVDLEGRIDDETLLGVYWRRLFHACLHLELDRQLASGELTKTMIRERIDRLGPIIWKEVNSVLLEENWLTPQSSQTDFYVEFVAVFLELKYFLSHVTSSYFPAIQDTYRVEKIISEGLNAQTLFAQTHLPGAREPTPLEDPGTDEANDYFNTLVEQAKRFSKQKNQVRAAILRLKASRVAPAERTKTTRMEATADLTDLVHRLQNALDFDPDSSKEWVRHLDTLLEKADQDRFPIEADLLRDLQNACQDHEREIYTLSIVDWAMSGGKRPVQRPLPSQQHVLVLKHLRNAQSRLTAARITQQERDALNKLIDVSLDHREAALRERYRPVLKAALEDSGFRPINVPEQAAQEKLIEEILDRFIEAGFISFGDLRDIIVRNQMKMADVASAQELLRGDALLQLDKRLGIVLDGVYRPGEFYLRGLERGTSLFFGTVSGRVLTKYLLLPFGAGFLFVQAIVVLLHLFFGSHKTSASGDDHPEPGYAIHSVDWQWQLGLSLGMGVFLLGVLHWPWFQKFCRRMLEQGRWLGSQIFYEIPKEISKSSPVMWVVRSWPVQLFYWLLLAPTILTLLLMLLVPHWFVTPWHTLVIFVAVLALVSTRAGRGFLGVLGHVFVRFFEVLREGLVLGLIRWVSDLFQQLVRLVENMFHLVDETLRFRDGQNDLSRFVRMVLGVIWFPVSALARFYFIVLIEPGFNPLKLPISFLIAKLMLPFLKPITLALQAPLEPLLGLYIAGAIAATTAFLLPDAFTFLLWELSSNWQLYEANRPKALSPVVVGTHGETMRGLLQPGFHSGTIPTLYMKLRHSKRELYRPQNWQLVRLYDRHIQEVSRAVQQFVSRNLLALLRRNSHWQKANVDVDSVQLAVSSIRIVLGHPHHADKPLVLEFSLQEGWLVGGMAQRGWFDELSPEQLWPLNTALAALYKLAGVQLVRDQIQRVLGNSTETFDITREALVVWMTPDRESAVVYRWQRAEDPFLPRDPKSLKPLDNADVKPISADALIYERVPLLWKDFVKAADSESNDRHHADVLPTGRQMVVSGRTTIMERYLDPERSPNPPAPDPDNQPPSQQTTE